MKAALEESEHTIVVAWYEEFQRARLSGVFDVLVEGAGAQLNCVDEGMKVEVSAGVDEMHAHRRQVRIFSVLLNWIVGSEKTRAEDYAVQGAEDEEPQSDIAAADHRGAVSVRIRGSIQ